MPYARRNYRKSRKPYRRSRKGYRRRRFARKNFSRGVPRGLKAGLYIPKQAYVKLPFTKIISGPLLTTGQNYNLGIWGNGICCPLSASTSPVSGDLYPIGLEQYANFYQQYRVLGASIKVQINSSALLSGDSASTQQASFYCALTSAQGRPNDVAPNSNWAKLSGATTENIISYPGTSWRLMSQAVGSRQNIFLKRFVKTKSVLGIKDVRDNEDCLCPLPGTVTGSPNGLNPGDPESAWFFMLRVDPNLAQGVPPDSFQIIVKVKYYVQFTGRDYNNQGVVPSSP